MIAADDRVAGVLLHPTSLWGPGGRGDLGPSSRAFLDWMHTAGLRLWQQLPNTPPGAGASPYSSPSAFAADPGLLSVDDLIEDGWLRPDDPGVAELLAIPEGPLDPGLQDRLRTPVLGLAAERALDAVPASFDSDNPWLGGWCRFAAGKEANDGRPWWQWSEPGAEQATARHRALQWLVAGQLQRLRDEAASRGIRLVGDLPIFVAWDSADVWQHRHLFLLDDDGRPSVVAGVPPDAFAELGQLWGNPLYDWDAAAAEDYRWWRARMRTLLGRVDCVRVDHFRGFAAAWTIPADAEDARSGEWTPGPGRALFDALAADLRRWDPVRFASLPVIAEDLGVITPDVEELRDGLGLPGMKILQFAFDGDSKNVHVPANHPANSVVYTGTHDNETARGWFEGTNARCRAALAKAAGRPVTVDDAVYALIDLALDAPARWCILPMQDLLGLGNEARMNVPGTADGNWTWRMTQAHDPARAVWVRRRLERHGRIA
jgi:4-alpha-glucanotransferase